jgi:selenocysteine-specific elongation factor
MMDVWLDLLPSAPRKLKNRAKARFHTGTSEIISTVVLLDRDELEPGESCFAQIRLDNTTTVLPHDRFVLRSYSPVRAIGGGEILHVLPVKRKRFSKAVLEELEVLKTGDLNQIIMQLVYMGRFHGVEQAELPLLSNSSKRKLDEIIKGLLSQKKLARYDKEREALIHECFLTKARDEILTSLTDYHRDFPLKTGFPKEELRSRTSGSTNQKLFNYIVNQLIQEGVVVQERETLRLTEHKVTLAQD